MNKNDIRLLTYNNLNELHYVSSVPDKTCKNKSKLTYLKIKLLETDDQKETRLAKRRNTYQTDDQKQTRLGKGKERNWTLFKYLVVLALEH